MKFDFNWTSVSLLLLGLVLLVQALLRNSVPMAVIGALMGGVGIGLIYRQRWARWLGLVLAALVIGLILTDFVMNGFRARRLIGLAGAALLIAEFIRLSRLEKRERNRPLISLVQLRRRANHFLTDQKIAEIAQRIWSVEFGTSQGGSEQRFVVGRSPIFMLNAPGMVFVINNFDQPYVEDAEKAATEVTELRLHHAVTEHRAWLSVDLLALHDKTRQPTESYPYIARIFADLLDDDCLAIYSPETNRMVPYEAGLADKLRGADPLQVLGNPAFAPVFRIDGEDPRMAAAVEEARRRWPEFTAAFETRTGENFIIKAPVTVDGNTEFIWMDLVRIEGSKLHANLANDPVSLKNLKCGDAMVVDVADLNDWSFVQNEDMKGGFTLRAIQEIQTESK